MAEPPGPPPPSPLGPCASEDDLLAWAAGALPAAARAALEPHLARCGPCRTTLSALARGGAARGVALGVAADADGAADDTEDPAGSEGAGGADWAPGTQVGRFVVRRRLGRGGMGVVYAADDGALGRAVALKVLRRDLGVDLATLEARFKVEAAAMAKTVHPAVVTLFDVGVHDGAVYLAMELIDGGTMAQWLATPRPWRQVVRCFIEAGRGLAAAHAAGVVHRDFKPDNVLLDGDGRPHVADFGVARSRSWDADRPLVPAAGAGPGKGAGVSLASATTRTAVLVGTPLYMAPEQLAGQAASPASDQFSFFVALATALYGERPFRGRTLAELRAATAAGPPRRRADHHGVPRRLWPLIRRGLAADPAARFPSLGGAVDALERALAPTGRRVLLAGVGLAAAAALAAGVTWWQLARSPSPAARCAEVGRVLVPSWGQAPYPALRAAFARAEPSIGADTAARVGAALDRAAADWRAMATEACRATRVSGHQTEAELSLRGRCLDRQRHRLDALAAGFARADALGVQRAVDAVAQLPPLADCADLDALAAVVPPPPPLLRVRADALALRLRALEARVAAGAYTEAAALAGPVVAEAEAIGYRPLLAEVYLARARVRAELGAHAEARADLEGAVLAGSAGRADRLAALAAVELVVTVAHRLSDAAGATALEPQAVAAVERAGGGPELADALARAQAIAAWARGDGVAAEQGFSALLARVEGRVGPLGRDTLPALRGLTALAGQRGDGAAVRTLNARVLAVQRALLAPDHPDITTTLASLAYGQYLGGQFEEARVTYEEALGRRERALGPDHVDVAGLLGQLAPVYAFLGRTAEAEAAAARAVRALRQHLGPTHRRTVAAVITWAQMLEAAGRLDEAHAALAPVVDALAQGPGHPLRASALTTLGLIELGLRRPARALEVLREADALERRAAASAGMGGGELARLIGLAHLDLGQAAAAVGPLEQARVVLAATTRGGDDVQVVRVDALLAEALYERGGAGGQARARELARQVLDHTEGEPRLASERQRLRAWMARRGLAPER